LRYEKYKAEKKYRRKSDTIEAKNNTGTRTDPSQPQDEPASKKRRHSDENLRDSREGNSSKKLKTLGVPGTNLPHPSEIEQIRIEEKLKEMAESEEERAERLRRERRERWKRLKSSGSATLTPVPDSSVTSRAEGNVLGSAQTPINLSPNPNPALSAEPKNEDKQQTPEKPVSSPSQPKTDKLKDDKVEKLSSLTAILKGEKPPASSDVSMPDVEDKNTLT